VALAPRRSNSTFVELLSLGSKQVHWVRFVFSYKTGDFSLLENHRFILFCSCRFGSTGPTFNLAESNDERRIWLSFGEIFHLHLRFAEVRF
jgi:hypothetical protein